MVILLNGKDRELEDGLSVREAVERYSPGRLALIVELNGRMVAKNDWGSVILQPGDRMELVELVGGG